MAIHPLGHHLMTILGSIIIKFFRAWMVKEYNRWLKADQVTIHLLIHVFHLLRRHELYDLHEICSFFLFLFLSGSLTWFPHHDHLVLIPPKPFLLSPQILHKELVLSTQAPSCSMPEKGPWNWPIPKKTF